MNILIKCISILALIQLSQSCNRQYVKIIDRDLDPPNRTKYPWLVRIKVKDQKTYALGLSYGSLIHPKAVLTAAIGIKGYLSNTLTIQTNCEPSSTLRTVKELSVRHCISRDVTKNVYSKNYDWQNPSQNDFAILILNEMLNIGREINVINLAQSVDDIDTDNCVYTRWMREFSMTTGQKALVIASYKTSYHNVIPEDFDSDQLINDRDWVIGQNFHQLKRASDRNLLNFMGSPLACPLNGQQTYVQVATGTFDIVIFLTNDKKSIISIEKNGSVIDVIHQRDEIMQLLYENLEDDSFISMTQLPKPTSPKISPTSSYISTTRPLAPNHVYSAVNREVANQNFRNSFTCC